MSLTGNAEGSFKVRGKLNNLDYLMITAYGIAVKNGFSGTEEEWLEYLRGNAYDAEEAARVAESFAADAKSSATIATEQARIAESKAKTATSMAGNAEIFANAAAAGANRLIPIAEVLEAAQPPDYVVEEAKEVVSIVNGQQNANTFTFAVASDFHFGLSGTSDGVKHLGQALNIIRKYVPLEMFISLGDSVAGGGASTLAGSREEYNELNALLDEGTRGIPNIRLNGNHDTNPYNYDGIFTADQIHTYVGKWNLGCVKDHANLNRNYGYLDFEGQKVRCIYLNTSDVGECGVDANGKACDHRISPEQYRWVIDALDLSNKSDASDWGILLFGHFPFMWYGGEFTNTDGETFRMGGTYMTTILNNYIAGTAGSFTSEETIEFDFSGKNAAKIIAYFHGHTHCFKTGVFGDYDIPRIAIPNACFGRNNEYGQGGNLDYGESVTYNKTANSAEDTAFNIVTVDRKSNTIYCVNYGAGKRERVLFGSSTGDIIPEETVTYTIHNILTNVTNSNGTGSVTSVGEKNPYSATLTADDGYEINSVVIETGGVDVTDSVYDGNGNIYIPGSMIGSSITITATAVEISGGDSGDSGDSGETTSYTNQIPISIDATGAVYNGCGYKEGYRISTSSGNESAADGMTVTGFIPVTAGCVIRLKDIDISSINSTYAWYGSDFSYRTGNYCNAISGTEVGNDGVITLSFGNSADDAYIRISGEFGENPIITVNEEITDNADSGDSGNTTTYTNQIPISVDSSGAVYNECGYKEGYRISTSSGGESAASGMTVTGFIPVTANAVVRLKDIDVSSGNSTYAWYGSDFSYRTGNYCNAVSGATTDDNGVITFNFNNGSEDAYIRISGAFGDNPIITVNEEIT